MAKNIFLCYCLIKERTSRLANSFYLKETFSYISHSHLKSPRINFDNEAQPCFHESCRKVNIHIGTSYTGSLGGTRDGTLMFIVPEFIVIINHFSERKLGTIVKYSHKIRSTTLRCGLCGICFIK